MFVALTQTNRLLNLVEEVPQVGASYRCPGCKGQVRLKNGIVVRPHFSHVSLRDCHYHSENESSQHLSLKATLYRWLIGQEEVVLEQYLPEIHQLADVFVNNHLALEVQCSSLSIQEVRKRSHSYRQSGYQVLWLLGEKLWIRHSLTSLQKQFLRFSEQIGFYLWELDEKRSFLRLQYMIHQDWRGKVHCLTKEFPFEKGHLLTILRFPYSKRSLPFFAVATDQQLQTYIAQQLYFCVPKWMQLQEQAYLQGKNLLTQELNDFYPQIRLPHSELGFAQISKDLTPVYQHFFHFYQERGIEKKQPLYPPMVYLPKNTVRK